MKILRRRWKHHRNNYALNSYNFGVAYRLNWWKIWIDLIWLKSYIEYMYLWKAWLYRCTMGWLTNICLGGLSIWLAQYKLLYATPPSVPKKIPVWGAHDLEITPLISPLSVWFSLPPPSPYIKIPILCVISSTYGQTFPKVNFVWLQTQPKTKVFNI